MNKIEFMRLWDLYGGLLTDTQREMTDMFFNLDLTVSEIAEQKGISRQAVSECLSQCKKQLEGFEETLHHAKAFAESDLRASFLISEASAWADKFTALHPEYAADIDKLRQILKSDYAEQISRALRVNPWHYSHLYPKD